MDLEALTRKFERELGLGEYNLSDEEIMQIYERIKEIRPENRIEESFQSFILKFSYPELSKLHALKISIYEKANYKSSVLGR